jgi:hypothetical protein
MLRRGACAVGTGDLVGAARRAVRRWLYQAGCALLTEEKAARGSRAPWRAVRRWLYQAGCAQLTDMEKFSAGGRVVETNFFVKGIPVTAQTVALRTLAPTRRAY